MFQLDSITENLAQSTSKDASLPQRRAHATRSKSPAQRPSTSTAPQSSDAQLVKRYKFTSATRFFLLTLSSAHFPPLRSLCDIYNAISHYFSICTLLFIIVERFSWLRESAQEPEDLQEAWIKAKIVFNQSVTPTTDSRQSSVAVDESIRMQQPEKVCHCLLVVTFSHVLVD